MSFHTVLFNKEQEHRGTLLPPWNTAGLILPSLPNYGTKRVWLLKQLSSFGDNHSASLPQLCLHQGDVLGTRLAFGVGLASVSHYTTLGKMLKLPEKHQVFSWANSNRQNNYSAERFWIHINTCKSSGTTSEPLQCHSIRRLFHPRKELLLHRGPHLPLSI